MPKTGGAIAVLASGQRGAQGIAVDDRDVYWASEPGAGAINKVGIHGGAVTTLATCPHKPASIALDAAGVYWTDFTIGDHAGDLYRVSKDGGSVTILASGNPPYQRHALAADDSGVYWTDRGTSGETTSNHETHYVDNHDGKVLMLGVGARAPVALADWSAKSATRAAQARAAECDPPFAYNAAGVKVYKAHCLN